MILYPAIDLKNGECVRLEQGDMNRATLYNKDPIAQAKIFANKGFDWLHVIDLDGAFAGKSINGTAVQKIIENTKSKIQLGGGIRTLADIEKWLDVGVTRVILGTAAVQQPELVKQACKKFPNKIAVAIDGKNEKVAIEGWANQSKYKVLDLAKKFEGEGVAAIIYTDISRDGLLQGLNKQAVLDLAHKISTPIIASGGIGSLDDIRFLQKHKNFLAGAICGRALYDGSIDAKMALSILAEKKT